MGERAVVPTRPRGVLTSLCAMAARAVGALVVVLVLNFALGAGWDALRGNDSPSPAPAPSGAPDQIHFQTPVTMANGGSVLAPGTPQDPRVHSSAMEAYPWRATYFRELQEQPSDYWPFTDIHNGDFRSRYINQANGIRSSFEPTALPSPHPVLAFYGGSTMWGEGQRDDFTIPSDIARLAQADGLPVKVVNHGIRGVSSFDEALLFESDMAAGPAPAIAVFYDGWNDCQLQRQTSQKGQPWQFLVGSLRSRVATVDPNRPRYVGVSAAELWNDYERHSLAKKLWSRVHDVVAAAPAGAAAPGTTMAPATHQLGSAAGCADVYRRARAIEADIAAPRGVDMTWFWQPVHFALGGQHAYRVTTFGLVGPPTINISNALDGHSSVYLDGGHTNETGAQLVAEAIYRHLRPQIEAWYRAHG